MVKWLAFIVLLQTCSAWGASAVQNDLPLAYLEHTQSGSNNRPLVIFLHGYGGNEEAMFALKDSLPSAYTYLSVRAPHALAEGGFEWFDKTNSDGEYDGDSDQVSSSQKLITDFIAAAIKKYRVSAYRVFLVGFSQGAMMSYYVALHHPQGIGGLAVLSGTMLPALRAEVKPGVPLGLPAVFIAHGTIDTTLPIVLAVQAEQLLRPGSVTVQFHAYPGLGHAFNEAEISDLKRWLQNANRGA
jgi:phospholipase/carboxylesterase